MQETKSMTAVDRQARKVSGTRKEGSSRVLNAQEEAIYRVFLDARIPLNDSQARQARKQRAAIMAALDPENREVFTLRFTHIPARSFTAIAHALGREMETLRHEYQRALARLKKTRTVG